MQEYNPLQATALISASRDTINNNMESVASHFSGTYFPTSNLVAGMYCWRTDLNKMYQLGADLVNWTLVNDMSQGYNSVAHANRADYATKDASGNDISSTYSKKNETNSIVLKCYPVGSIYMSVNSTDPATLFGGSWQQLAGGRVLIGQDSSHKAGTTGGSETVTAKGSISNTTVTVSGSVGSTTLNANQIPAHSHNMNHYHSFGWHNSDNNGRFLSMNTSISRVSGSGVAYWNGSGGGGSSGYDLPAQNLITSLAAKNGSGVNTDNTGGSQGHTHSLSASSSAHGHTFTGSATSVVQPYLAVYMWKRVG